MTSRLAVTVVGHDRPGIISQVAEALAGTRMNLEDSSMTLLRGHFAMTLICAGDADAAVVSDALAGIADETLTVTVLPTPADTRIAEAGESVLVTVHGADRLGIVSRLTGVIADAGGNITDLTTRLSGDLYVLTAEVDLPPGKGAGPDAGSGALSEPLQRAAAELGVRVTVRRAERDDL